MVTAASIIKGALQERQRANENLERVLRECFPVSAPIAWECNKAICHGVVVTHAYGERIKVRNEVSNTEYFIHAYRIV